MCRGQYHCRGATTGGDVAGERERGPGGLRALANSGVDTFSDYRADDIEWRPMRARWQGKEAGQAYLAAAGGRCSFTFSPAALRGPLRSARCRGPEPLFPWRLRSVCQSTWRTPQVSDRPTCQRSPRPCRVAPISSLLPSASRLETHPPVSPGRPHQPVQGSERPRAPTPRNRSGSRSIRSQKAASR
jgi:hypothetical protein